MEKWKWSTSNGLQSANSSASASACSNGNWSFWVRNDLFTLFLNDVTLVVFLGWGPLLHLELWKEFEFFSFHWLSMGSVGMLSADTKWSTLRWQNYSSSGGHLKIILNFAIDFELFIHSRLKAVRVWIQINWITFSLTGTFKNQHICGTLKYFGKQKYIALGYYEESKTHKTLIDLYLFYVCGLHTAP